MEPDSSYVPPKPAFVMSHQKIAMEKILAVASAKFSRNFQGLAIKPRTNTLIIGPSGTGKSFLARCAAQELKLPFIQINTSEWMLMGSSRTCPHTWPMLIRWLAKHEHETGTIVFLDEVDKIASDSCWDTHLRNEVYRLLDLQVPEGLDDEESESRPDGLAEAQTVLSERTLILAAGAFQYLWEGYDQPRVGFNRQKYETASTSVTQLVKTLPRELVNRFRTDLIILPQLNEGDYRRLLKETQSVLPFHLQKSFLRLGEERITDAVNFRKGCRFVEEVLLDAIIESTGEIQFRTGKIEPFVTQEGAHHG